MKTYCRKKTLLKSFEVDEVCRLCLSKDCDMREIFIHGEEVPLAVKIMACISIEVYEGDGMPSQVCITCIHKVEMSYKFKQKCEESDGKLRHFIKSFKNVIHKVSSSEDTVRSTSNIKHSSKLEMGELENNIDQNITNCLEETCLDEATSEISQKNYDSTMVITSNENSCTNFPPGENALLENIQSTLSDPIHGKVVAEKCGENIRAEVCPLKPWDKEINKVSSTQSSNRLQLLNSTSQCSLSQFVSHRQESVYKTNMQQNCMSKNSAPSEESNTENIQKLETQFYEMEGEKSKCNKIECEPQLNLFLKCEKCPRSFSKRMDLMRHNSVHDEQRGFVCNICEKWFSNKSNFIRHRRIHTGEKPYSCQYCPKQFAQVANLNRHTMLHTGNKPFKCEICNKAFTQRDSLKVHMRQHSTSNSFEIQQYYCPLCEKGFCHQSGLSRHFIVHSGKTFNCNECSKRFTDQSSLRRHIKRGHPNSNQKCNEIVQSNS